MNTLRVDGEIFESGMKKVADSKISRYMWTGPCFAGEILYLHCVSAKCWKFFLSEMRQNVSEKKSVSQVM